MKFNLSFAKDIGDLASRLMQGLTKLNFDDNFSSFKEQGVIIKNGEFVTIQNKLTFVPESYIIVNQKGHGVVTKHTPIIGGSTREWDNDVVYLKNNGPNDVEISVIFRSNNDRTG